MKNIIKKAWVTLLALTMVLSIIPFGVIANAEEIGKVVSVRVVQNACVGNAAVLEVELTNRADKIQFVKNENETTTYARDNENVKGIVVNEAENEVWTVVLVVKAISQDYKVLAKYGAEWTEDYAKFVLDSQHVVSASVIKENIIGGYAKIDIELTENAEKVQLIDENGKTVTFSKSDETVKNIVTNDDGNEVWTIEMRVYKPSQEYTAIAKFGSTWTIDGAKLVIKAQDVNSESIIAFSSLKMFYKNTAKISPAVSISEDVDYTVIYEASDASVVTVDNEGNVLATGKGNAKITCTVVDEFGNTYTDTCDVEVKLTFVQWIVMLVETIISFFK